MKPIKAFFIMSALILIINIAAFSAQPLQVVSVKPKGELSGIWEANQISITFNMPVISLEKQQAFVPDWFSIYPSVAGEFQWIGTQTLTFRPNKDLPYATQFRVELKNSFTAVDGSKLPFDYIWTFTTPTPFIQYSIPRNNEKSVDIKSGVSLYFNIPVYPSDLYQYARFYDENGVNIAYMINNGVDSLSTEMQLKPVDDLEISTNYSIDVAAGLKAAQGQLGSKNSWSVRFRTYELFNFVSMNNGSKSRINPKRSVTINFTNPVEYADLVKHIQFNPQVELKDYSYSYRQSVLNIYGPFLPDTSYSISIFGELKDVFGNALGKTIKTGFRTRSYDPKFKIPTGESVVESYGDLNVPLEMVNLTNVTVKVKNVSRDSTAILGSWFRKQRQYSQKDVQGNKVDFIEKNSYKIKKNERYTVPFNLSKYLKNGRHGILIIQFDAKEMGDSPTPYKLMMTQATDLGITAKFSPVSNGIYVTYLKTGEPVNGVDIQIRDGNGKVYWSGLTDELGYCQSPGWQRLGMPASKEMEPVQWVVASLGEDVAYTHSERGTGISPWEFNIPYEWQPRDEQIDGAIFTDRGIYRAEDTVKVKVVMRAKHGLEWRLSQRDSFKVVIDDPGGNQVYDKKHRLNDFNAFDFVYPIAYDAKRGYYSIRVEVPQKLSWDDTIYETFRVEDYKPAEFEVEVQPLNSHYIFRDSLKAKISANYLFGAPMKKAPIRWFISKSHYYHQPPGWDGYYFNPANYYDGNLGGIGSFSSYVVSRESELDESGSLSISYFPDEPELFTSAKLTLEGEVTDQNRRRITGRKQIIFHRGEYQVGVKAKSFFGSKGKRFPLNVITVDKEGGTVPGRAVNLHFVRRNWYSVRKAGTGGRYQWESQVIDSTVAEVEVKTKNKPVEYDFMPDRSGYYLLRATSVDSRGNVIVSDCSFYVTGNDYVAWQRSDDDRIEMEIDKKSYKPGDVATIMIKSPFENATAVVTVEREGIIDHFTAQATGSTPTIKIPIREIYLPNVYVSVMLIQGRVGNNTFSDSGEDIAKPAFKMGYVNIAVSTELKRLNIDIATNKTKYKPGELVTIHIKAADWQGNGEPSEVILAVVDKGVLNLTGYRFTNLHDYFYRSRPLSVTSAESRLNIIGQRNYGEKGENRGGGGAAEAMELFQMRSDFRTTPYWNPSIITDELGNASVSFKLPDNLTTFVIMAAVHNKSSEFGNGESMIRVSQTLVLKPSLPRFIRLDDTISAGVVLHNYSENGGDASVTVNAAGVELLDKKAEQRINLNSGESHEIRFNFRANDTGSVRFSFNARMGGERDGVIYTIPVHEPVSYEVVATSNNSTKKMSEKIIVPDNCHADMTTLQVKTSATQLIGVSNGIEYLFDYPYGCLEQRLSRILPMVLFSDVVDAFNLPALQEADYSVEVQRFFDKISDFQTPDGGFTYWPGSGKANPYVSAWTVYGMIKAKANGYSIDTEALNKSVDYLRKVLHKKVKYDLYPYAWNYWAATNCLILYDLALQGHADHAYIEKMYRERERVPLFGLAYLMKTMKLADSSTGMYEAVKAILLNGIADEPTTAHFEEPSEKGLEWCFHSNVRTTAHILQSMLELGEDFPQAPKVVKWLLIKRNKRGVWRSTQENIFVLDALSSYFKVYEKEIPDFNLQIKLAKKKILKKVFKGYSFDQNVHTENLNAYKAGDPLKLEFKKKGSGRYYYETRMKYFPLNALVPTDQGMSVLKKLEVVEGQGTAKNGFDAGAVVKISITVATSFERNYVVLDDPLPAGFEVINTNMKTVSESYKAHKPLALASAYWGGFNFYEIRDEKVLVFADNLPAGVHTFVYLCEALTPGKFKMPATKIEEMYTPEVFGRTGEQMIIIR